MRAIARELRFHSWMLVVAYLVVGCEMPLFAADYGQPWCKVRCGDGSTGSGSLVDRNDRLGLVATAFHVVRDVMPGGRQNNSVVCEFINGELHGGTVVSFDEQRDLCAIIINRPEVRPVMLAGYTGQGTHSVYGFPKGGPLRPSVGRIIDDTRFLLGPGDYPVAVLSAPTVGGQSGGAVVTDQGMCGIMWGCDEDDHANMTCGKPFDEFMVSLTQCYSCYGGKCWAPSQNYSPGGKVIISNTTEPPVSTPVEPKPASWTDPKWIEWRDQIEARIAACKCTCDHTGAVTMIQVNQAIATAVAGIEMPPAYVPPTPEQQAAAIAPHLTHSATIRLPDGSTKTQTKPLGVPLNFIQHPAVVKQ